jgi:beta-galactosidase
MNLSKKCFFRALTIVFSCGAFFLSPVFAAPFQPPQTAREKLNFDLNWKYIQGTPSGTPQSLTYGDGSWATINLPHNFQTQPRTGLASYYRGVGWYRRHFTLSSAYQNKVLTLYFEGAMTVATVYINGNQLTTNYGGMHPFCYDITQYCTTNGSDNVVAVQVDNTYNNMVPPENPMTGIDYEIFGGLNKDVYLIATDKLYVPEAIHSWNSGWADQGGHFITYTNVTSNSATVQVETWVKNTTGAAVSGQCTTSVVDAATNEVVQKNNAPFTAGTSGVTHVTQTINVTGIKAWSPWSPNLYRVYTVVYNGTTPVDIYSTRIGIRSITWSKTNGAYCNGTSFKLLGLNRTNQWPFIAHACPNNQQKRDATLLREYGCNFVRCSHYPMDDAFYDGCDSAGLLLWVEVPSWCYNVVPTTNTTWVGRMADELRFMVRNGRNRPSIAIWSVGLNEATKTAAFETPQNTLCHAEDPTRPTSAPRRSGTESSGNIMDFYGQNEFVPGSLPNSNPDPNTVGFMNTEHTGHMFMGHSIRATSSEQELLDHATMHALMVTDGRNRAWCAGSLGWCAFDYYTHWNITPPPYYAVHGVFDLMHIVKPAAYFYKSQSAGDNYDGSIHPMVKIANFYASNSPVDRRVYSNCQQVRLYQGTTLVNTLGPDNTPRYVNYIGTPAATWNLAHPPFTFINVAYQAGTYLRAEGLINSIVVAVDTVRAPGNATTIKLVADPPVLEANGQDISRIEAYIVDANGTWVHSATTSITFTTTGTSAELIGDNPTAAQAGASMILARATTTCGTFSVQASPSGLTPQTIAITVNCPTTNVVPLPSVKKAGVNVSSQWRAMLVNNSFVLPAAIPLPATITLYTVGGEQVYRGTASNRGVRISGNQKLPFGIYIVKVTRKE